MRESPKVLAAGRALAWWVASGVVGGFLGVIVVAAAVLAIPGGDPAAVWVGFLGLLAGAATGLAAFALGSGAFVIVRRSSWADPAQRVAVAVTAATGGGLAMSWTLATIPFAHPASLIVAAALGSCAAAFALHPRVARTCRQPLA